MNIIHHLCITPSTPSSSKRQRLDVITSTKQNSNSQSNCKVYFHIMFNLSIKAKTEGPALFVSVVVFFTCP